MTWPRPVPVIGDQTSAAQRRAAPDAWRFPDDARAALYDVVAARRDVRRFRPDPVQEDVLERVLTAGHAAPSVGHSQPWRFLVVQDPTLRERASVMADAERLAQAQQLDADSARHLLDLQLEGIREAPLGIVVCCDRRAPAAGVLGRATFPDADLWSCACAIQNMWLAARAEGLGLGATHYVPVAMLITALASGIYPAMGTFFHFQENMVHAVHVPHLLALRDGGMTEFKDLQGIVTMPSYHTAQAILFMYVFRGQRRLFPWIVALNSLMLLSTPSMGGHYLVDMLAGAVVAAIAIASVRYGLAGQPGPA